MNSISPAKESRIPLASFAGAVPPKKIRLQNITKVYGKTSANADISFEIEIGTIHSIIGQNGAGKSTLMKILYGLEKPDAGDIFLDNDLLQISTPRDALKLGIGLLQQEFSLVEELSAIENLILGNEPINRAFINLDTALKLASELEQKMGLHIPWKNKISTLSIAQKQQVEILRLLANGANVLILDEPTAVLAPAQVNALLELLTLLRKEGKTIIFISHKLREVLQISDAITVLRDGKLIDTLDKAGSSPELLANMIVGEKFKKRVSSFGKPGDIVLDVSGIDFQNEKGISKVKNCSLAVKSHSVMGICGIAGNGQEEFMQILAGINKPAAGKILLMGRNLVGKSVKEIRGAGISYISPDRKSEGLAMLGTLIDSSIGGYQFLLARYSWLSKRRIVTHTQKILKNYEITHGNLFNLVSSLSGGNQQRLMVGREISHEPKVLLASQPSRGVDLGGVDKIHGYLREARDSGSAIILASEDLDELFELSDSIAVFFGGTIQGVFNHPFDRTLIGNAMLGFSKNE